MPPTKILLSNSGRQTKGQTRNRFAPEASDIIWPTLLSLTCRTNNGLKPTNTFTRLVTGRNVSRPYRGTPSTSADSRPIKKTYVGATSVFADIDEQTRLVSAA